jgi:chromosome segregation protein
MKGFKSFGHKVELIFGPEFNCILGPNGSGKSNVMDALCFVLGKGSAKGLRAEKSANLIYNGGKTKKPAKSGEVHIIFDNSDQTFPSEEEEIKITRIIKENGQSVYKINDQKRTRQQILDLLATANINPDGYNIILQGDIVRMVEMPTVERRKIVEDIAGISIYEEKKNKALNELNKVEEKLSEAEIILTERSTYLKDLKKDRDQAMKYKELNDKIDSNKATYLKIRMDKKQKKHEELEGQLKAQDESIKKEQEKIDGLKKAVQEKKKQIDDINKEIERKGEKQQVVILKEIEQLKVDIATNKTRISSSENEIVRVSQRKDQLQKNLAEIEEKIGSLAEERSQHEKKKDQNIKLVSEFNEKIKAFRNKHKLDESEDIETDLDKIDQKIDEEQKEILKLREDQQNLLREKDRIEFKMQSLDSQIEKVLEVKKEHKQEIEKLSQKKNEFKKATIELNQLLNKDSSFASQLGTAREKLQKAQEEHSKLSARNISIREKSASNLATQSILDNRSRFGGEVHGLITQLGKVKSRYSLAMEVACGQRLQSIVVDSDKTASECIKYLKQNKLGIATFLPLNKMKKGEIKPELKSIAKSSGSHGFAIDVVSFDRKFRNAFFYVLGSTLIVDSIDVARRIGVGRVRMVTLDGDLIEMSGAMHGGFRQKRKGLGFKEEEVETDLEELEKKISDYEGLIARLENDRSESEERIVKLREFKANLEGEIIKTEKSLHLESGDLDATKKEKSVLESALKDLEKKTQDIDAKISDHNKKLTKMNIDKAQLRQKITQMKNPRILAELNTFDQKISELKEENAGLEADIRSKDMQISNILTPEKENINKILNQHDKEESNFKKEIETLKEKIKTQSKELKEKEEKQKEFYSKYKELFKKKDSLNSDVQKEENNIISFEEKIRKIEQRINTISIENASLKAELAGMEEDFKRYEKVELIKNKSEEQLKKDIWQFERMVESVGSVNMKALEIYDLVEKEYNSLIDKKKKLLSEKEDVLVMMNEIETKKKAMFMETFEKLNTEFKKMFSQLTTKGDAFLSLENPEDPFEGGLIIKVRITGKKFLDIRSLSGGEKTMTALAFIFAIQEFQPASFYFLDEVDAALDKRNSEKLSNLIKIYCDRAQYIVISHNDGVIGSADTLYGVSMNEHGISKVVSLKI